MTHRGMSSGRSAVLGIMIAIRAMRHMWSDMLSAWATCLVSVSSVWMSLASIVM